MPKVAKNVCSDGGTNYVTSGSPLVDFFSSAGSMLNGGTTPLFNKALAADKKRAMQLLFWLRDVRGGAGNRSGFRDCLKLLAVEATEWAKENMDIVPELGRWDDMTAYVGTPLEKEAIDIWAKAIADGNKLACKWAPRATNKAKKPIFDALRKALKMSPKDFRKTLAKNTEVVETAMCQKEFDKINYNHVPSVAMSRYRKTFSKHDCSRFGEWIEAVKQAQKTGDKSKGAAKMNAAVLFPHDVVRQLMDEIGQTHGFYNSVRSYKPDAVFDFADTAFAALPDYIGDPSQKILCVVDCSGSMGSPISSKGNVSMMDVAHGLGMYCSARIEESNPFHKMLIPFSRTARFFSWKGLPFSNAVWKLRAKESEVAETNMSVVLQLLLDTAKTYKLKAADMPSTLMILSDMQFNGAVASGDDTVFEEYKKKFVAAGLKFPKVIFWNLNSGYGDGKPTTATTKNMVMISGFAPSIMKTALKGGGISAESIMMDTIGKYETLVKVPASEQVTKKKVKRVTKTKAAEVATS